MLDCWPEEEQEQEEQEERSICSSMVTRWLRRRRMEVRGKVWNAHGGDEDERKIRRCSDGIDVKEGGASVGGGGEGCMVTEWCNG